MTVLAADTVSPRTSKANLAAYPQMAMRPLGHESPWFSRRATGSIKTEGILNSRWWRNRKTLDLLQDDGEDDLLVDLLALRPMRDDG